MKYDGNEEKLEEAKNKIDLLAYIEKITSSTGKHLNKTIVRINPCPICGHKDHFDVHMDTNSYNSHSSCCKGGTIIDFLMEYENLSKADSIKKVKALAGIIENDTEFKTVKRTINSVDINNEPKKAAKDYDFTVLVNELHKNVVNTDYFKRRGFSDKIIDKYKLGYEPKGYNATLKDYPELKNKIKFNNAYPFIIPIWDIDGKCKYFIVRRDDSKFTPAQLSNNKIKTINMKKEDPEGNILAGPIRILNDRYFMDPSLTGKYIFICESWGDALSIEELGYSAVSTNSTGNTEKLLELVMENKKNLEDKVIIIAGNNDNAGSSMNSKLTKGFKSLKINFHTLIISQYNDINQWLTIDRQGIEAYLKDYINNHNIPQESNSEHSEEPPHISGIFEYNNCYCKWTGKGDDFKLKEITNFVIEPLELISMDDNAMEISTNIITKNGKVFKRTLNISDLMGGFQRFKKALRQLLIFDGKDGELEAIKKIILSTPFKNKTGVTHTGFHYINKKWVYVSGNKAIDQDLNTIEDTVMLKGSLRLDTSLLNVDPINKQELTLLASKLLRFNDISKTSTIIGHTAALFLKEKLWANNINFNHLLVIGEAGSGKSQTVRYIISPLVGIIQRPMDAGNCTKFAIIKTAASSNTMPFIIEEYKPSKIGKFIINEISEFLRNSYDHYQAIRGNADQGINEYDMLTPAILVGEDSTDETAIIERSLLVSFSKIESLEDKHTNAFMFLKENGELLNKLGRALLNEALKIDVDDVKRIHDKYANDLVTKDITSTRIVNSVANAMTGITLLKKVFDSVGVDFALIGYSPKQIFEGINKAAFTDLLNENKTSKTAVDLAIEIFDRMANPAVNKIWEGIHFKANPDEDELALDVTGIYDIFRKYVSEYKITECEELTKNQFTKQLRKSPYFKDYKPVRFYSDGVRNKSVLKRAFTLSIKELELKGLDLNYMHQVKEAMSEAAVTA